MKLFKSIRELLSTTSSKLDTNPSPCAIEETYNSDISSRAGYATSAHAGQDAASISGNGLFHPTRSFDRPRGGDPASLRGGSMRLTPTPMEVAPYPAGSQRAVCVPLGNTGATYTSPHSPERFSRVSRPSPLSPSGRGPPVTIQVGNNSGSPVSSVRSSDNGYPATPGRAPSTPNNRMSNASPRNSAQSNAAYPAGTHANATSAVHLQHYAQHDGSDGGGGGDSPSTASMLLAALSRHRHSTGSYSTKIHRADSLKALLHLDQYSFFSDVDVQEAQLQVDTQLLESLLSSDDYNIQHDSGSRSNILAVSPALPHVMKRVRWSLKDYVLIRQLHKGYASDVFQAQCKLSGEMVALKVYKLAEQCDLQRVQLYREIRVHSQLEHTNVVQFYAGFLEDERVVLIQEFAGGGDLLKFMAKSGGILSERQAVNLVLQPFLAALHYLHTQGIVHRDIKPENVLLTDQLELKLADFGLAIDLNEERANTRAGTLDYMAPEVLRCPTKNTPDEGKLNASAAHYQLGADAWAVGVFAYELITGLRPFKAKQNIEIARNIIHAQVAFPENMSELSKDFISQALKKHPGDRPTVVEMLHHPWVSMFKRRSSVAYASVRSNSIMEMMLQRKVADGPGTLNAGSASGGALGGGGRRVVASSEVLPRGRVGGTIAAGQLL